MATRPIRRRTVPWWPRCARCSRRPASRWCTRRGCARWRTANSGTATRIRLCGGTVPDPKSSTVAAAITLAGGVTFPSRAALARQLAADDPKTLARREKLLDEHMEKAAPVHAGGSGTRPANRTSGDHEGRENPKPPHPERQTVGTHGDGPVPAGGARRVSDDRAVGEGRRGGTPVDGADEVAAGAGTSGTGVPAGDVVLPEGRWRTGGRGAANSAGREPVPRDGGAAGQDRITRRPTGRHPRDADHSGNRSRSRPSCSIAD